MVILRRSTSFEAKENSTNSQFNIIKNVLSKCVSLTQGLTQDEQDLIKEIKDGVQLSDLFVGNGDLQAIKQFLAKNQGCLPVGPARALTHLKNVKYTDSGFNIEYNGDKFLNPRVFLLLNRALKRLSREYQKYKCSAKLTFQNPSHADAYSLYTEEKNYPPVLSIVLSGVDQEPIIIKEDHFNNLIADLKPKANVKSIENDIKNAEQNIKLFPDTKLGRESKDKLDSLYQQLEEAKFINGVIASLVSINRDVLSSPSKYSSNSARITGNMTQYRNTETVSLAINQSNIGSFGRNQSHIIVSLYFTKIIDGYQLVCFGNQLADTVNLHLDNSGRLSLN